MQHNNQHAIYCKNCGRNTNHHKHHDSTGSNTSDNKNYYCRHCQKNTTASNNQISSNARYGRDNNCRNYTYYACDRDISCVRCCYEKGEKGDPGQKGEPGDQGAQGPQGTAGQKGEPGDQGAQGPQGSAGAQGPQGPQGAAGEQGPQGPQGAAGAQGPQGDTGAKGDKGDSSGESGANYFVILPFRVEAVKTTDVTISYLPWLNSEFSGFATGTFIYYAVIVDINMIVSLYAVSTTAPDTLIGTGTISASGTGSFSLATNPTYDCCIELRVRRDTVTGTTNPQIYGCILEFD